MEDPVAVNLNVTMRYISFFDLLQVQTTLRYLLVRLDYIDLLGACIVKPVATAGEVFNYKNYY